MVESNSAPTARDFLRLTTSIVSAYVRQNALAADGLPTLIGSIHRTLTALGDPDSASLITDKSPAFAIKKSITPDYIVCLEDGKRLKMLKRYIRSRFKLTPEQYRTKWGLPRDYPMVAPNYAKKRSDLAKQSGLGRVGKPAPRKKAKNSLR